ncbi:iron-containing alcohol dehydrogenase [Clostridioides mangenotii]|uniref:1-propanol dehydrogenase PduQ n=1 Tax=Metaclostridioides mangenotii TaxID=1540 RepID=UPI00214A2C45|nr:1-propanol dehydrogenase PduQ [Clostridioides mangenotii]MCR1955482.1 iron-containing alcohol dehydrogenase [Clostridioides mangenotii]
MYNFELKTSIKFGLGSLNALKEIRDKNVLIITDPFMIESGSIKKITENLEKTTFEIFSDIVPDPPIETIVKGVEYFNKTNPDVIVAVGGGSAIDAAKAILDFSKKILSKENVEFIAIPTTSGTGSEVTSFAVITDKQKGVKYPLVSDELLPNIAILDPELVKTVPDFITADTGMDVLTHAIEAYVSTDADDFSDAFAEKAIKLVFKYLRRAYKNGDDIEAREKMHIASCLAGLAFNHASLGINHSIAHALGGKFKIPHGRANSLLLPHVIEYNADIKANEDGEYSRAAQKYYEIAKLIGLNSTNVRVGVRRLINEIKYLQSDMKMVTKLSDCSVSTNELHEYEDEIALSAINDTCTNTNPKVPTQKDIINILDKVN